MKKCDVVIKRIERRPGFFGEVFAELRRNNPWLAGFMSKEVFSDEEEPNHDGILKMVLIGLNLLGSTDRFDDDFVKVPEEAILLSQETKIVKTDFETESTTLVPDEIMTCLYQISINFGVGKQDLFDKVFKKLELAMRIILTAKTINTMNIPH